ncbi:MAG TPA: hypothetical protein VIM35_03840 [Gallionella sp.]
MSAFAFYKKVVALNSDQHRNLKFAANQVNFCAAALAVFNLSVNVGIL